MKNIYTYFITLLLTPSLCACSNKAFSPSYLPKQFIEIGSYGGIAGTQKSYYFFPNGQRYESIVLLGVDTADIKEYAKLDPKKFKSMMKSLKAMDLNNLDVNQVGNRTYFIKIKTKKQEKILQWNNMRTAPHALVNFYKSNLKNTNILYNK
ncbi:MAG: hypothetical protein P8I11_04010 [Bacteroidia bacterium]|nr:hypothetical protein [Bacteroidia bacterium]